MTITRRTRSFAALAAAASLALTACGGDDSSSDDSGSESSSESSSASETTADDESSDAEGEETGDDSGAEGGTVTAQKSGVTFDAPEGWQSVNPSELLKDTSNTPKALEEMAKAQGTTVDQLLQSMAQSVDVMVMAEAKGGFADNINVVNSPQMPTESQVKQQLEQTGATVASTEQVKTSPGTALATTYTLSMGDADIEGRMLAVPTDKGAAMITVSASDKAEADKVAKGIIDSVEKTS